MQAFFHIPNHLLFSGPFVAKRVGTRINIINIYMTTECYDAVTPLQSLSC